MNECQYDQLKAMRSWLQTHLRALDAQQDAMMDLLSWVTNLEANLQLTQYTA